MALTDRWLGLLTALLRRCLRPDARNSLAVALTLAGHDRWPRSIEAWPQRRVLALSPHPDDEAIGCAGALLSHVAAGAQVTVLQVSDGRHGDRRLQSPTLSADERARLQQQLIDDRRAEALAWGREAGVAEVRFLGAEDGRIGPQEAQVARLAQWLDELQPELIYLPFVTDLLEDHWQTSRLLDAALQRCGGWARGLLLRGYEVWSPLPANRVADISHLAQRKRELLDIYVSQLRDVDYRRAIEGLNSYRAMLLAATGVGQAEAFFEASLPLWRAVLRRSAQAPAAVDLRNASARSSHPQCPWTSPNQA